MSLFIKNIFLVQLCLILAILYPTSLANLVVEVGTRHSHQTLLMMCCRPTKTIYFPVLWIFFVSLKSFNVNVGASYHTWWMNGIASVINILKHKHAIMCQNRVGIIPIQAAWIPLTKGPVIRNFDVSFVVRLKKLLNQQSSCWLF